MGLTTMLIKVYDRHGRLWISKPCQRNSIRFFEILSEAKNKLGATCAFLKDGKTSIKISFQQQKEKVYGRYTGSDGIQTWTIPIRPSAYPLTSQPHGDKNNPSPSNSER